MMHGETEYQYVVKRIAEQELQLEEHQTRLAARGLNAEKIKRVLDPIRSFHEQLTVEVKSYECQMMD